MKVKIFANKNIEKVEDAINEFFNVNQNILIKHITHGETGGNEGITVVLIFYLDL